MSEPTSDIIRDAVEALPRIEPSSFAAPIMCDLVLEVVRLRQELVEARHGGQPQTVVINAAEASAAPAETAPKVRRQRRGARKAKAARPSKPRRVKATRIKKPSSSVARSRKGPIAAKQLEVLRAICKEAGGHADRYASLVGISTGAVYTYVGHLKARGFIVSRDGAYTATAAGAAAAAK